MRNRHLALPLLLALAGCQPAKPAAGYVPGVIDPGNLLGGYHPEHGRYHTISYPSLRATLSNVLMVTPVALDPSCTSPTLCPVSDPLAYLDANQGALGAPDYSQQSPNGTINPGPMTAGGFKVWYVAASSACGLTMQQNPTLLFPDGNVANYKTLYLTLLGRSPTPADVANLDQIRTAVLFTTDTRGALTLAGAAECATVLSSLEFLGG